jgi:hypothetical protein
MDLIINEAKNPNRHPIELLDPRLMQVTKIRQLFNRPYWSRVWVIQEIALSEYDPLVGCGDKWIPWSKMVRGVTIVVRILHRQVDALRNKESKQI